MRFLAATAGAADVSQFFAPQLWGAHVGDGFPAEDVIRPADVLSREDKQKAGIIHLFCRIERLRSNYASPEGSWRGPRLRVFREGGCLGHAIGHRFPELGVVPPSDHDPGCWNRLRWKAG